jgi:hypothetical protein
VKGRDKMSEENPTGTVIEAAIPLLKGVHAVLKKQGIYEKVWDWVSRS